MWAAMKTCTAKRISFVRFFHLLITLFAMHLCEVKSNAALTDDLPKTCSWLFANGPKTPITGKIKSGQDDKEMFA